MKELFQSYLQNSISLSVIGIIILALLPLFSLRYSARFRYSIWIIVFFALIIPIRPQTFIKVPRLIKPFISDVRNMISIAHGNSIQMPKVKALDIWQFITVIWVSGALCFLLWHTFHHFRFMSVVKRWSEEIAHEKKEEFYRIKSGLGIKKQIDIRTCACIRTPMMVGFMKPVILFPRFDLSDDEFSFILKHELVHYKNKDLYYKVLIMMVLTIHWFNPVVHIMAKSMLELCEISCDEEVLRNADSTVRSHYGETIISVIRKGKFSQTALSTNLYSGAKSMRKRIYAMMDMKRKRFSFFALIIITICTFCGVSVFALTIQPEQVNSNRKLTVLTNSASSMKTNSSTISPTVKNHSKDDAAAAHKSSSDDSMPRLITEKHKNSADFHITSKESDVLLISH